MENYISIQNKKYGTTLDVRDLSSEERLSCLQPLVLKIRRERGDFIVVFRVIEGMEKLDREDLCVECIECERTQNAEEDYIYERYQDIAFPIKV